MAKRKLIYIGVGSTKATHQEVREIFRPETVPTQESHGKVYGYVTGPFKTIRGATFMMNSGHGNPHCVTVNDAERIAKGEAYDIARNRWVR